MFWNKNNANTALDNSALDTDKELISIVYNNENEFASRLQTHIKEAAENAGYKFILRNSKNYQSLQYMQVESARKQGKKGIIINLVSSYSASQIIKAAGNMKVVLVNTPPADMSLLNQDVIYVGSDEAAAGIIQGEWLSNYYMERGITEIRYILFKGPPTMISSEQRSDAVLHILAQSGITAIPATLPIVANYMRPDAMSQMLDLLRNGIKFDTIISTNDLMAMGAIEAMESLDMDPSKKVIVGTDATESAFRAILEGKLDMTVFQNAKAHGSTAVKAMINMLNSDPITKSTGYKTAEGNPYAIWIQFELLTRYHVPDDFYFSKE